jgi:hypothetical protein
MKNAIFLDVTLCGSCKNRHLGGENRDYGLSGIHCTDHVTPIYPQKLALNFADKWRALSLYSV